MEILIMILSFINMIFFAIGGFFKWCIVIYLWCCLVISLMGAFGFIIAYIGMKISDTFEYIREKRWKQQYKKEK